MRILKLPTMLPALLAILILISGCSSSSGSSAASTISKVTRGNISVSILASGSLITENESNLAFYSAGTVKSIHVKVGDMVNEGDVLAELDTADLESSLAQANINVKQARLNLESALEPTTNSSGTTVISAPDPLNIEIKELGLTNAKAALVEAEKKLSQATIRAPFKGLVTEVNAVDGDQVSGTTTIIRMIDPENFKTTVYVNETEIYNIKVGTPATIKISALPKNSYTAKVDGISETATVSSNVVNYKVTVKLDPVSAETGLQAGSSSGSGAIAASSVQQGQMPQSGQVSLQGQRPSGQSAATGQNTMQQGQPGAAATSTTAATTTTTASTAAATTTNTRLKEGLTVTVSIIVDAKTNILLVPNKAITSSGGKYYAQVVDSTGNVQGRVIQVGITDGTNTEITSGLSENEQVSIAAVKTTTTSSSKTTSQNSNQSMQMMMNVGGGGAGTGGPPSGGGAPAGR